ncbi:hypothetical protein RFI_20487 [Reticulomyxa filosa]|uniref:Uncharacterized protein n=1 Tax=Reticulomyxa filosa TaxID=46433 RepID=X6MTT0_RETFI|nr:hypothetical protein RFI_20487 [Reticulomyxa filosa]|eukprot:ETO16852.1 hypothetical protein RFI_20487 [Reticulomyxa filosa]
MIFSDNLFDVFQFEFLEAEFSSRKILIMSVQKLVKIAIWLFIWNCFCVYCKLFDFNALLDNAEFQSFLNSNLTLESVVDDKVKKTRQSRSLLFSDTPSTLFRHYRLQQKPPNDYKLQGGDVLVIMDDWFVQSDKTQEKSSKKQYSMQTLTFAMELAKKGKDESNNANAKKWKWGFTSSYQKDRFPYINDQVIVPSSIHDLIRYQIPLVFTINRDRVLTRKLDEDIKRAEEELQETIKQQQELENAAKLQTENRLINIFTYIIYVYNICKNVDNQSNDNLYLSTNQIDEKTYYIKG